MITMRKIIALGFLSLLVLVGCRTRRSDTVGENLQQSSAQVTSPRNASLPKRNVFRDEQYKFEIAYPEGWFASPYPDVNRTIYFGQTNKIGKEGYDSEWGIVIYSSEALYHPEDIIAKVGSQFGKARKEQREQVTIDGASATKVTVTTTTIPDWISENIFFEANDYLYWIHNGARPDEKFEDFYNSFKFLSGSYVK